MIGTIHNINTGEVTIVEYPDEVISPEEQRDSISNAISKKLDDLAVSLRYDSILSARSYAGYPNPFQAEALKLADYAAACWVKAGEIELSVINGAPLPTVEEALAQMPDYI